MTVEHACQLCHLTAYSAVIGGAENERAYVNIGEVILLVTSSTDQRKNY